MRKKRPDSHPDLQVCRFNNGIKLVKSTELQRLEKRLPIHNTGQTVDSLLQLPISFYLLNTEGKTEKMSAEGVDVCGFSSIDASKGKTILEVSEKTSAARLLQNCQTVMTSREAKIFEEEQIRNDGLRQQFLSIKSPWYDADNKIIGTCGFSIVLGRHPLADSLSLITQFGLLNSEKKPTNTQLRQEINGVYLSKRETECLRLTVKGYTAKKIARSLEISHRTVEEYLTNIRIKLSVASKGELIELANGYF